MEAIRKADVALVRKRARSAVPFVDVVQLLQVATDGISMHFTATSAAFH